jgi:drug/metabolite transporter (DMT)-like permease
VTPARKLRLAHILLIATPAFWAVNYLVARVAIATVAPHALALGRWVIAATVLTLLARGELGRNGAAIRREWPHFAVFGMLGMWICGTFVYIGARSTSATNIGLLYAISPVLIALVSTFALKERMGPRQAAGVALALAGVVHVVLKGQWAALARVEFSLGDLWILAAALSWTVYALLLKVWRSALGNIACLALSCWAGVLILGPLALVEAFAFQPTEVSWQTLGYMLVVALLPGVAAYLSYAFVQRELGAARAGVVLYLGPLYTAFLAWAVLGEAVHGFHFVGAALILPGIFLATRPSRA